MVMVIPLWEMASQQTLGLRLEMVIITITVGHTVVEAKSVVRNHGLIVI